MTMSVSSLKNAILHQDNPTQKDGDNYFIILSGKKYSIITNDSGAVVSTKRDREGVWDKIKSAVCDFFGISTSKRLVKAYNEMIAPTKHNPGEQGKLVITETKNLAFTNSLFGEREMVAMEFKANGLENINNIGKTIKEEKEALENNGHGMVSENANTIMYCELSEEERAARAALAALAARTEFQT